PLFSIRPCYHLADEGSVRGKCRASTRRCLPGNPPKGSNRRFVMRIEIVGHQIEVTPALRDTILAKLDKLGRYSEDLIDGRVTLSVERLEKKIDATLNLSGHTVHAEASDEDMYNAIDQLLDKLVRQVTKHKEKHTQHRSDQSIRT